MIISKLPDNLLQASNAVPALQTDLIADALSDLLSALGRHALRHSDGGQPPGLRAEDPAGNPAPIAVVQQELWDLREEVSPDRFSLSFNSI